MVSSDDDLIKNSSFLQVEICKNALNGWWMTCHYLAIFLFNIFFPRILIAAIWALLINCNCSFSHSYLQLCGLCKGLKWNASELQWFFLSVNENADSLSTCVCVCTSLMPWPFIGLNLKVDQPVTFFPLKESTPKAPKTPFIVQFLFKRNLNNKVLTAQETPEFAEE